VEWRLDHGAEVVTIEAGDVLVVTKLDRLALSTLASPPRVARRRLGSGDRWPRVAHLLDKVISRTRISSENAEAYQKKPLGRYSER
jgi:hypothetical protein